MTIGISVINSSICSLTTDVEEVVHINDLPFDILDKIFNMLPNSQRAEAREVCKRWSEIITTPYPHVTVYGVKAWEKYFGFTVEGEVPELPHRFIQKAELMRRQLKGKGEAPTCSLTLMPKGLFFNKLRALIRNPKEGYSTTIKWILPQIVEELGDRAIDKTCWVLFTEAVVEGSRRQTYDNQKALVAEKTNSECMLPGFLEAIVCVAFKCARTGERIFPWIYTRCEEKYDGWPLVVGGFSAKGLCVNVNFNYADDLTGVAACWKF